MDTETRYSKAHTVKRRVSDTLAWVGFSALILWITSIALSAGGLIQVLHDLYLAFDSVLHCPTDRCEFQMTFTETEDYTGVFASYLHAIKAVKLQAFLLWLGIGLFQSVFVGRFRLWPWKPLPEQAANASTPPAATDKESTGPDASSET